MHKKDMPLTQTFHGSLATLILLNPDTGRSANPSSPSS